MTRLLHICIVLLGLLCAFSYGKYGSTCSEQCHCTDGVVFDPSIGCPFGPCEDGYSGINSQVHDTCYRSYQQLCTYSCVCEDGGPCRTTGGSCGNRECRHFITGNDCQLVTDYFIIPGEEQSITSPGYPLNYERSVYYEWNLLTYPGKNIILEFIDFKLEKCCDYVVVKSSGVRLARLNRNSLSRPIVSLNNRMVITFVSDNSITSTGFNAKASVRNHQDADTSTNWLQTTEAPAGPNDIQAIISQNAKNDIPGEIDVSFGIQMRGVIIRYNVQIIDGNGDVLGNTITGVSPVTITGGFPCESVTPQVAACTLVRCGEFASGPNITMNPAAPGEVSVNVKGVPLRSKKLYISWSAPEVVHCPIVEYRIEYKLTQLDQCQDQSNEFEVKIVNHTETEDILTKLIPFSTYDVVVSAGVNGMNGKTIFTPGRTGFGHTSSIDATAPPDNIINHKTEDARSLNFTWEEIPCGHRKGAIERYNCILKIGSRIVRQKVVRPRTVRIRGLIPCTTYTFTVSGRGPNAQSSDSIEARTNVEVPETVKNVTVLDTTLVWDRPPPLTCDILKYHIHANLIRKDQCEHVYRNEYFTVEDPEVNLLVLEPYSRYRVTISAETDAGLGLETDLEFITPQKVPKRGPKEVNVTAVSDTAASFAWSLIECGYRRGPIRGYKFSLQDADGHELIRNVVTNERHCEIDDLKPFTEYVFSVKGFNSEGDGISKELHITTDESSNIALSVPSYLLAAVGVLCFLILVISPALIFLRRFYNTKKKKKTEHPKAIKLESLCEDSAYEEVHTYMSIEEVYTSLQ